MPQSGLERLKAPTSSAGTGDDTGISMDQLAQDIVETIKSHADPAVAVTPETELDELGIHSLELTEIIFDLEEAYGIEIEMNTAEAWSRLKNVDDIIEAVRGLIAKKG